VIYVLDASVAMRWYIPGSGAERADRILRLLLDHPQRFALPELFLYEVLAVLHRHHAHAHEIYTDHVWRIAGSGVLRYPLTPGIVERIPYFIGKGLTGYDAAYVALAQELNGIWLTFDSKAHERITGEGLSIDLNLQDLPE
jgi:predicted nucleic acid-binding protein